MELDGVVQAARREIGNASCRTGIHADQLYLVGGAIPRWFHGLPRADLDFIVAHEPAFTDTVLKTATCVTPRAWTFSDYQILRYRFGTPPGAIDWFDLVHCSSWIGTRDFYIVPDSRTKIVRFSNHSLDYISTLGRMVKWLNLGFTMDKTELVPIIAAIREIPKELYVNVLGSLSITSTGEELQSDL